MKAVYPVIITQDGKDYLVDVPDLDIQTEGTSVADAIYMARDAIGLYGITAEDDGKKIKQPSAADSIDASNGVFAGTGKGFVTLVDVDFDVYRKKNDTKMVRRNVTIPSWMDAKAKEEHLNVSEVLRDALMAKFA